MTDGLVDFVMAHQDYCILSIFDYGIDFGVVASKDIEDGPNAPARGILKGSHETFRSGHTSAKVRTPHCFPAILKQHLSPITALENG